MLRDIHTIFRSARLPWQENDLSRRYLALMQAWVPTAASTFSAWAVRPNCGHFYGGCGWYGEETCSPAFVFALAASSPEYNPTVTGFSRHALRLMAYQALRYLCFTHDTGPADCIRPAKGWGRSDCCGNKWGERGRGFFPASQCGVTLGQMAVTALLLSDLLDDETWAMLEAIYADYAERFAGMSPRSGVYLDTQMEENAWTSLGLASAGLLLGHHPQAEEWLASAKRWMFLAAAAPQDAKNQGIWDGNMRVSQLVGKTFTTLPDYLAENHGIVHPTYTAASLVFLLEEAVLYELYSLPLPHEAAFNRREIYAVLKRLTDRAGMLHPPQGMDWPYLRFSEAAMPHTAAALVFKDADAARLEQLVLERAEQVMAGNEGRMYHRDIGERVNNIQEPLIMWEYQASNFAYAYAAHRLLGPAPDAPPVEQVEQKQNGVRIFPHSGFIFHRHSRGQSSFSWRNTVMALALNSDGLYTIAPATGSLLAQFAVRGQPDSQQHESLQYDVYPDCYALNMVMDRCQGSLRQQVLFASLPDGTVLLTEKLIARRDLVLEYIRQGFMRIINEHFPHFAGNCCGQRKLYTACGEQAYSSYISTDPQSDIIWRADDLRWVNIDDRMGIAFQAEGSFTYLNRHYFDPWWAVADDLYLGERSTPQAFQAGQCIANLTAVLIPDQPHCETAGYKWRRLHSPHSEAAAIMAGGYLAAANWGKTELVEPFTQARCAGDCVAILQGKTVITPDQVTYHLTVPAQGARLRRVIAQIEVDGSVKVVASEPGSLWVRNIGTEPARVRRIPGGEPVSIAAGAIVAPEL